MNNDNKTDESDPQEFQMTNPSLKNESKSVMFSKIDDKMMSNTSEKRLKKASSSVVQKDIFNTAEVTKRKSIIINQKNQLDHSKSSSKITSQINSMSAIDNLMHNTMGSSVSNSEIHKTLYRERSKINY